MEPLICMTALRLLHRLDALGLSHLQAMRDLTSKTSQLPEDKSASENESSSENLAPETTSSPQEAPKQDPRHAAELEAYLEMQRRSMGLGYT